MNPRRERYVLRQWVTMRDRGIVAAIRQRAGILLFWLACFAPGILIPGPYRPYVIGMLVGFILHNLMTVRASHAFWPVMRNFIDWNRVETRLKELGT